MVMPSKLERVLGRLNERNIKSKVMINDLQQLIDNENPANLTKQTQDYNFRAGTITIFKVFVYKIILSGKIALKKMK